MTTTRLTDPSGPAAGERRDIWTRSWQDLWESLDSEWNAAYEAFTTPDVEARRKWLGWALYRIAARVNPEIRD
jgi:hypothetical protein